VAGLKRFLRRLAGLPWRARLALAAAVVLAVGLLGWMVWPSGDGGDDEPAAPDTSETSGGGHGDVTSTTLATGGIEIDAPEGWATAPVPDLGFGIAVPPGWEITLLSPDGLAALANAAPAVPGFVENAHAAASAGGVLYAAGQDPAGAVSDLVVRAAPATGVADVEGLETYGRDLAAGAGHGNPSIDVVEGAARPTVRLRFQVGAEGEVAEGTETLVLGPDGLVWSVVVTSDDAATHDELAATITDTLTLAG
jgi:hypothetical protein